MSPSIVASPVHVRSFDVGDGVDDAKPTVAAPTIAVAEDAKAKIRTVRNLRVTST